MSEQKQINFKPAPGYVLAKPVTRESLAQRSASSLALPDNVGKEKDMVGVAEVIEAGPNRTEVDAKGNQVAEWRGEPLSPGDLIAYIPFTDAIIPHGFEKRNLVPYRNIMAVSKSK